MWSSTDVLLSHPDIKLEDHLLTVYRLSHQFLQEKPDRVRELLSIPVSVVSLTHDAGKATAYFQEYIRGLRPKSELTKHSLLSAFIAFGICYEILKKKEESERLLLSVISYLAVRSHHGDLKNVFELTDERINFEKLSLKLKSMDKSVFEFLSDVLKLNPEFNILAHEHVLKFCAENIGNTPILASRYHYFTIGYDPNKLLSMTLDREALQHNYYTNEELEEMARNQNSDGLLKDDYDAVYVLIYDLDKPKFECMSKDELISYFKNMGIDLDEWFYGAKAGLKTLVYQGAMLDLEESEENKEIAEWFKTLSSQDIEDMVKEIEKEGVREIKLGDRGDLFFANPLFRMVTNVTNATRFSKRALRSEEIINVLAYKHLYQVKHPSFNLDVLEKYANRYPDIESYRRKVREVDLVEKPTNLCPSYFLDYLSLKYVEQINPKAIERIKKRIPEFGQYMSEIDEIYRRRQELGLKP